MGYQPYGLVQRGIRYWAMEAGPRCWLYDLPRPGRLESGSALLEHDLGPPGLRGQRRLTSVQGSTTAETGGGLPINRTIDWPAGAPNAGSAASCKEPERTAHEQPDCTQYSI